MSYEPSRNQKLYGWMLAALFIFVMLRGAWLHYFPDDKPQTSSAIVEILNQELTG